RASGFAGAAACALVISALTPFDAPVAIVLAAQGIGAVLTLSDRRNVGSLILAGVVGGLCAGLAYAATFVVYSHLAPWTELQNPLRSALLASILGGLTAGAPAAALRPLFDRLLGEPSRRKLVALADLENPLLRKIALEAPGSWQHSLAMATLAEKGANAIGADPLPVRAGASSHDLGTTVRPHLYIQ